MMTAIARPAGVALKTRFGRPGGKIVALTALLVIGVALVQVNQFSAVTGTGYEIDGLQRERAEKQAANHALEAEVAEYSSLTTVEKTARTELGMVPAGAAMHIDVAVPVPDHQTLPTRFLPAAKRSDDSKQSPFWRRLLDLIR
jgi:cell division protein FtsL